MRRIYALFSFVLTIRFAYQYETMLLKTGQNIVLLCEDDAPVHFCYPPLYTAPDNYTGYGIKYNSEAKESFSEEIRYKATLEIKNITYTYTGYYHCLRNEPDKPCRRKMDSLNSTYIFVEDSEHLLVVDDFIDVRVYQNESAVLPCLPTHPDTEITLFNEQYEKMELGKQKESHLIVSYDKSLGYILGPINARHAATYICRTEEKTLSELICSVIVEDKPKALMPLNILKDSRIVKEPVIIREHSTLVLTCTSAQYSSFSAPNWTIPNQQKANTQQSACRPPSGILSCKQNVLTIKNISKTDAGTYNCSLFEHGFEPKFAGAEIKVVGENETAVSLKSTWNSERKVQGGTNPMKIVVDYNAPENIKVKWFGPENKEIVNSNKYTVTTKSSQTILDVANVTVYDAGNYTVEISDKTSVPKRLTLSAIIQDKPEIQLESPSVLFNPGKTSTFECKVYSSAPVDISWTFTKCDLKKENECGGNRIDILNRTSIRAFQRVYYFNLAFKTNEEGILHCVANNTCSKNCNITIKSQKIYLTELQYLNESLSLIDVPEDIVTGKRLILSCAYSTYFFEDYPFWEIRDRYGKSRILSNSSDVSINTTRTKYTIFSNVTFFNITKALQNHTVTCKARSNITNPKVSEISLLLNIQDPEKPKIINTNLMKDIEVNTSQRVILYCKSKGVPKPEITWFKNGDPLVGNRIKVDRKNSSVTIRSVLPEDEGEYSCLAKNSVDEDMKIAQLIITDKPVLVSIGMKVVIAVLLVISVGLIIFLVVKIRKERKLRRELNLAGLANFEKGALENINPELPVDEQADLLPYDKTWEFPVERLKLGKMLGAGAFGVVMKAEAYGILDDEPKTTVAVKMVKSGSDRSYIRALATELKIMAHLGKHLNVVNLLGASTKRLNKMELMVIVEFCRFGNLHNYLLRHRDDFVDQVDHTTGEINLAIGMDKLARSHSTKSKTTLKQRLLSYSSSRVGGSTSGGSNTDLQGPAESENGAVASDMSVVLSPNGEPDECLLSSGSGDQPAWRVKYGGDYKDSSVSVCTQNLLCWAFQIACGMEYLASRKVLHGDLAARNVLLADDNIVKICDFGLARNMYRSDNYKKKGGGPLPVKWMALESIRDHIFSTQSDVWSFGIVLWELFSLSRTPYPGMEANEIFLEKLLNGYRMEQPSHSPNAVYKVMLKCWQEKPTSRPSFQQLAKELGDMLDDNLRRHFEELNNPYVDMNEQRQSSNDYLSMMSSPNYRNLVSSTGGPHEYVSSAHPSGSDYLNMKSPLSPMSTNGSVFEYSPENGNASGYMRMSVKDNIFSPGHVEENPFKFSSSSPNNKKESYPMKTMQSPGTDNYVNIGSSVSNPAYVQNVQPPQKL